MFRIVSLLRICERRPFPEWAGGEKATSCMNDVRIVFRSPNVVELESFALDESPPGPHEVIVDTRTTLISPGTELALLQGKLAFEDDTPPDFPMLDVGYANIGTVLAAGSETQVQPGDRGYTMGHHASRVRVDVRSRLCVPVPPDLTDDHAVFARMATVSMTTLITTIARPGDSVAVVGLGLVGNLAAQVFTASGMRVNAFDLAEHRRDIACQCGVEAVHDGSATGQFSQLHRLVIEATGSAKALAGSIDLAAAGGEIVMIGAPWGGAANSVPSSELTRLIFFRFLRLRSGSEWEIPRLPQPLAIGSNYQNSVTALDWLAQGRIRVEPLITHRITPPGVPVAYAGLRDQPNDYLGVVIDWENSA
jgi:2-desacetyl-2-hydroxyethyl bacteriochlorophyllide A dehydrogenase